MSKNIWIINEYAGSVCHGMEFRHYYLSKEFVKLGHDVTMISSTYSHLLKIFPKPGFEYIDGIRYLWIKTFNYGNSHDKRRVLKWFLFMFKIFFLPFYKLPKPDTIIVSPMAPFTILPGFILAKFYKAKLIFEVKDIWPLSLIEIGGYSPNNPFIKFMGFFERFALLKSDEIVSNLPHYDRHIADLGIKRNFTWISNGIDLDEMKNIAPISKDIEALIPHGKFVVGYTGTIGTANSVWHLIEAAKILNDPNLAVVIVGDGQEKAKLIKYAQNIKNIVFIPPIKKNQVQSMLKHFDFCYLGWLNRDLYRHGISANKLFDYMYAKKPIIHAINIKDSIAGCGCEIQTRAEDPQSIAQSIAKAIKIPREKICEIGKNGYDYVTEHFTYHVLAKKYEKIF